MNSRTMFPEIFAELSAPFDPDELKSFTKGNKKLFYVTARSVMNRLDQVLGPENWWDDYKMGENSVMCRLTIVLPDGRQLTKVDAGAYAGMPDQGDDDKSAFSDGIKRAAVKFGVGRYLYRDGVTSFDTGESHTQSNGHAPELERQPSQPPPAIGNGYGVPRTGRALFAWTKEQGQKHEFNLLQWINGRAKEEGFPAKMLDWNEEQVAAGHIEMLRKLESMSTSSNDSRVDPPKSARVTPQSFGEPNGDIPRPKTGRDLYLSAKEWEGKLGVTLVPLAMDFAETQGIEGKMAEWRGDDLDLLWRFLSDRVAKSNQPKKDLLSLLRVSVWNKSRRLLSLVYNVEKSRVADEQVMAEINKLYEENWQGEVIESLKTFDDVERLEQLERCFDELIAEQQSIPAM